ncbi:High-affinity branched-chain amino acid transport system permease protein LivH [compost metagenome]
MFSFLQTVVSGVSLGCVYALIALGFVLIYKATEMVNFAQGELMMLGAYVGLMIFSAGFGFTATLLGTAGFMFIFGYVLDMALLRRALGEPQFVVVTLTIGLSLVLRGLAGTMWGSEARNFNIPFSVGTEVWLGIMFPRKHLVIIAAATVLFTALYFLFAKTRIGIAMQGTSQNQLAANYVGIPVKRMFSLIWGISAAVAAMAGIFVAPVLLVDPNMGAVSMSAFAAAVVGGFGSIPGAVAGGIIIGLVQQLASFYLPQGWGEAAPYLLMLAVLVISKEGLFGRVGQKKV